MSSLLSPLTEPGGALALGLRGIRLRLGGGSNGDDVERFRRLYGSLLRDVAPPPPGGDGEVQGYGGGPDVPPNGPMDDMHRPQERGGGEPSRQRRGPLPSGDETASAPAAAAAASTPSMLPLRQREERGRTVQSDSKEKARAAAAARQSARYMWSLTEASAWRILSATPSPDKEGNSADTALAVRDEGAVATMAAVRAAEDRAVTAIEDLGEAIAGTGTGTGEGEVWDYFCDKNILALLVDIAAAKPAPFDGDSCLGDQAEQAKLRQEDQQQYRGVVWSPRVKAQVFRTVSLLISGVKDETSLYFLLSNNHVNDLTGSFLPMGQWTSSALEVMMPEYIGLLKALAVTLAGSPHLLQFFVNNRHATDESPEDGGQRHHWVPKFPLLHSSVHILASAFAQSDSFAHVTALNIVLSVCQIPAGEVRALVGESVAEQRTLLSYLCQRLSGRYRRIAHLSVGVAAGDASRSAAIGREITELQDQIHFIDDLLWCSVRPLNVRLCEYLLRNVLSQHVLPGMLIQGQGQKSQFSSIAEQKRLSAATVEDDSDIITEVEAMAQASVVFLTQMFLTVEYAPLLKMCAVAILHPLSPADWSALPRSNQHGGDYVLTPALNAIVQKRCVIIGSGPDGPSAEGGNDISGGDDEIRIIAKANPHRRSLLSILRGEKGHRRFVPVSMLLQSILETEELDEEFLTTLEVLTKYSKPSDDSGEGDGDDLILPSPFEEALATFFTKNHSSSSRATMAIECAGSLALSMMSHLLVGVTGNGTDYKHFHRRYVSSSLVRGVGAARELFALKVKRYSRAAEVSGSFMDLVEFEISRRYETVTGKHGQPLRLCDLNARSTYHLMNTPEILVQKLSNASSNDIEDAKFAIRALFYFRSICEVVEEVHDRLGSFLGPDSLNERWGDDAFEIRTVEVMEGEFVDFSGGAEKNRPQVGADLDVRGRTFFYFTPTMTGIKQPQSTSDHKRRLAADIIRMTKKTELMIVLDPTDLFILKPNPRDGSCNRGTILCSASIGSVITAVSDKDWLHIAIRETEDIGVFIRNGNMSLHFDSVGTCLIVKQYLERCRSALSSKMIAKVDKMIDECTGDLFPLEEDEDDEPSEEWSSFYPQKVDPLNLTTNVLGEGEEEVVLEAMSTDEGGSTDIAPRVSL